MKQVVLLLCGGSGSGKTTLLELLAQDPRLCRLITCTTRKPRSNEIPGKDYYFLSREEFLVRRARGDFLETAEFCGELYGVLSETFYAAYNAGKNILLNVEVQGHGSIRALPDDDLKTCIRSVFLDVDAVELRRRILNRDPNHDPKDLEERVATSARERLHCPSFNVVLVNGTEKENEAKVKLCLDAWL